MCDSCVHSPSDGRVGQLLLLAHHRGSGDRSEASEYRDQVDCGRVRRAGRRAFWRSGRDGCRDGALFQPSCTSTVRTAATAASQTHTVGNVAEG